MTVVERIRAQRRESTIARLREFLAAHPPDGAERVILFGSLARGDFDGASDADLLLVGGDGWIDSGVFQAAGRNCDIIPIAAEALRQGLAEGHPFAVGVAREGVELWRAPDLAAMVEVADAQRDG